MQDATTPGGVLPDRRWAVAFNQLAPVTETGLPTPASTTIDSASVVLVSNSLRYGGVQLQEQCCHGRLAWNAAMASFLACS